MLKYYHYSHTSVRICCKLLSIFYCDLLGWWHNGGSWVNMHWSTIHHVTRPKSDPFDPMTLRPIACSDDVTRSCVYVTLMSNVAALCSRYLGKLVRGCRYGSFTWRVSAWWLQWCQCWASPTDHSYVHSLSLIVLMIFIRLSFSWRPHYSLRLSVCLSVTCLLLTRKKLCCSRDTVRRAQ